MKDKTNRCINCTHWNNKQAELGYDTFYGICTCYKWEFNTNGGADCVLLDRQNLSDKYKGVQRFESQKNKVPYGSVNESRYCFVTEEAFGCIHHKAK